MAHVVNGRDGIGKRRGVKLYEGESAKAGCIILKQSGMRFRAGQNVGMGKDYTLYALTEGKVQYDPRKIVSVVRAPKQAS